MWQSFFSSECAGNNTTITTVFWSVTGNIARGPSTDLTCEVAAMTKGNIPSADQEKQLLLYLLPGYVKNLLKRN